MLSAEEYVRLSLEYDLFWLRIMREHAIFIESAIPPIHKSLATQADGFKQQYDRLLAEAIRLANGAVPADALQAGQYVTRYTEAAEQAVQHLTGIEINSALTRMEYNLEPYQESAPVLGREQQVSILNQYAINLTNSFARLKSDLLNNQAACRLFTFLYFADLNHVLHEALKYLEILGALQKRDENFNQNYRDFWNHNMADHAKSMRGLFDPTEVGSFEKADSFAKIFDAMPVDEAAITDTRAIAEFKANTTQGLIECKVKALMSPLYTDHLLREANHYLYLQQ